jgi:hypothetical protein
MRLRNESLGGYVRDPDLDGAKTLRAQAGSVGSHPALRSYVRHGILPERYM